MGYLTENTAAKVKPLRDGHKDDDDSGGGAFGASGTTGPDSPGIDEKKLATARDLGKRVAEVTTVVKRDSGKKFQV